MTLLLTLALTVLLQRNTCLFPFPLPLLSSLLWHCMRPNLPFLSAASNAILKHDGPLKWKMRLVKDARLTEVMKIATLTSPFPDVLCLSSPRPRLRHGRRLAFLSRRNPTPNFFVLFFTLLLSSLLHLLPLLTFQLFLSQEIGFGLRRLSEMPLFCISAKALRSRARGYLSELRRATCPKESHLSIYSSFSPAEFFAAASNPFSFSATSPDTLSIPC